MNPPLYTKSVSKKCDYYLHTDMQSEKKSFYSNRSTLKKEEEE